MKAKEILDRYVKKKERQNVGLIAVSHSKEKTVGTLYWYHIHENEELPEEGFDIAIHLSSDTLGLFKGITKP